MSKKYGAIKSQDSKLIPLSSETSCLKDEPKDYTYLFQVKSWAVHRSMSIRKFNQLNPTHAQKFGLGRAIESIRVKPG